jgi:ribosomal protein S27AE
MSGDSEQEQSRETCDECEKPPKGVTMAPDMDGWSCPYCGHYNDLEEDDV